MFPHEHRYSSYDTTATTNRSVADVCSWHAISDYCLLFFFFLLYDRPCVQIFTDFDVRAYFRLVHNTRLAADRGVPFFLLCSSIRNTAAEQQRCVILGISSQQLVCTKLLLVALQSPTRRLVQTSATLYTIQVHSTIPLFGTAIPRQQTKQILSGLLRSPRSFAPPGTTSRREAL